ncbi:hypothetical protein Tco_0277171 [Tanacetum coccineum]
MDFVWQGFCAVANLLEEIDNPYITIEEYVEYETEKALRNNQVYNWETAKYGKIEYIKDINYLRFFETKFPAIVYDDALSSQHIDKANWKNKTSLFEHDDEKYNIKSKRKALKKRFSKKEKFNILSIDEDLFSYDIFSVNYLKLDKDKDEDKIGFNMAYPPQWIRRIHHNGYGISIVLEVLNKNKESGVIIEQLSKDGEKNVFWSINEEVRESLLNLKNTTYHSRQILLEDWNKIYDVHNEVACLMLGSMITELQRQFEKYSPYDMHQELKSMFEKQARVERNYNMNNMGKTIGELHALLIDYEKSLPKKAATPQVLVIQGGRVQKPNKKPRATKRKSKGKGKGKN